ncbi:MAG TPA: hypothetical protein P5137_16855, partial [Candidatus Brocadiia bacterium]|nr:hypothetical protein [Candidatus Brocadiia bacterium]
MSQLKYNSYVFSPTPALVIDQEPLGNPDGPQQAVRETWRIRGALLGDQAALITAAAALDAAFAANGGDLTLYANDGVTVLRQLLNSGCPGGTHVVKAPAYPDVDKAAWATHLPYELAVSGVRIRADAPNSTAWGSKVTSTATDAQGQVITRVSGKYSGPGAQDAANAAKLTSGVVVVSEEQSVSAEDASVSFNYEYVSTDSREVISFVETVTMNEDFSTKVFRKVLGGAAPARQTTVLNEVTATQEGSAVGRSGYPAIPGP